ncbi:MAG: aminotransferase class V-fold PLP-dependent enzyme [Bacteroidia bacterium]|nr:aminotransferase class V-fold PLP-dependent enzyme [Bacteroidia bacterium]
MKEPYKHFETISIRTQAERSQNREHSVPLYLTSSFVFDDAEQARALFADEIPGNIYSRFSNPNTQELIDKMCLLEHTEDGIATATGMAAVFSSMAALLKSGDHIVASRSVFGSTHQLFTKIFPAWGIHTTYVGLGNPGEWKEAIRPNTKMFYLETPSNPGLELGDLEAICEMARQLHIIVNVDNCFATPYLQTPADFGADLVVHSATKFLDGQGRVLGGLVLGKKELIQQVRYFTRHTGPSMSPFNAWVISKSLETLAVRMDRHCENALFIYERLKNHQKINKILYPGSPGHPQYAIALRQMKKGGAMIAFDLKGGYESGKKFLNCLQWISHTANLGDSRTIATHPASTTHSKLTEEERQAVGIMPGLIRISCGLEHKEDILEDILQALNRI